MKKLLTPLFLIL